MPAGKRKDPKDEIARRGRAIYDEIVKPRLKAKDKGKFAAIDIETGEYEIAPTLLEACDRINERIPKTNLWLVRIGSRYLISFGGHKRTGHE